MGNAVVPGGKVVKENAPPGSCSACAGRASSVALRWPTNLSRELACAAQPSLRPQAGAQVLTLGYKKL
jgi:hypothetical protein